MKIVISGGGTGGHVFPALAIAEALAKSTKDIEILFVGAKGRMEMERVPAAGYPIKGLWISGFQRKRSLKNWLFPIKLMTSLVKAGWILFRFKPDIAVGVGGYASGPTLEMAYRMGIPIAIQEQNSWPGITNRILAKKAGKICVAYAGMERFFPPEKLVITGNPVRASIQNPDTTKQGARQHFGLDPEKKTLVVLGGSLGAKTINEALAKGTDLLKGQRDTFQVLWQTGKGYAAHYLTSSTALLPNVQALPFIDRMDLAYAMADLVISRAGALSISEIALTGNPSILVPSPNVAEDHQRKNALALVEKEAAGMIEDSEAGEKLLPKALITLEDEAKLRSWSDNIRAFAKPEAAQMIAKVIKELVGCR